MRRITLCLLVLGLLGVAGCCGAPAADPFLKVRSPVWLGGDPVLQPIQYGQVTAQPQATRLVPLTAVQPIQAPAAAPCP